MGIFGTSKPNVKTLARREDIDGLVEAAGFQDLMPDRAGMTHDLGVPIREQAILALGSLGPEAGNGTVAGALRDPSDRVRVAAVRVLFSRQEPDPLLEAMAWLPAARGHSRQLALRAILELSAPGSARALAGALVRRRGEEPLGEDDAALVLTLLAAEESPDASNEVVEEVIAALADEREVVGDRAEELLTQLAPASTEGVIAELEAGNAPHRAASVLGRIKDTRAMKPLVEALGHRDPRVRAESASALGELRDPAAVEPLLHATRDPEHLVRAQAGWALDRIGTVAVVFGVSALVRPMIADAIANADGRPALNGDLPALPAGDYLQTSDPTMLRRLARFLDRIEDAREADEAP
jgi:HEAT repeat protein